MLKKMMIKAYYSDLMRSGVKWVFRRMPVNWIPYPQFIEVEVTTMPCPIQCRICENPYFSKEVRRRMTFDEFKLILDQFPKLKWLGTTGIGEAWTNPDYPEMLRYAKKEKKVFIEMYDNFYFLDKDRIKILIKNVDKLWISIDGCTKKTYEKIRINSNFKKVVNNLQTFFEMKKKYETGKPKIDFHFIINKINLKEVPDFIDFVASFDIQGDFLILFTKILHPFKEVTDIYVDKLPSKIIKETEERAKKHDIWVQWAGDIPTTEAKHAWTRSEELTDIKYCMAWVEPYFCSTGHVFPCCAQNEFGKRKWQIERCMGNIFETKDFKKIWFGPRYTQLKRMIRANLTPPYCVGCPVYKSQLVRTQTRER